MSFCRTLAIAAPLLLALSACGDEAEVVAEDDGREASGEVLEGTISDAMLPIDQVRSQAPLAEVEETSTPAPASASEEPAAAPAETAAESPGPAVEPAAAE